MKLKSGKVLSRITLVTTLGLVGLAGLAVSACDNNPAKDKAHASVSEPVSTASAAAVAPGATSARYVFSAVDSKVGFTGAKVTRKHEGSFGTFVGTIQLVDGNPEKSNVTVEIDVASLTADDPKLTAHLKSPDLFDATKFPKAKFTSTSIKAGGEKGATHTVTGNLELHGVTRSITFPATIKTSADMVEVDAEFAINRKDFGVVYPGMPDDLIKDEILMHLQLHARKATT